MTVKNTAVVALLALIVSAGTVHAANRLADFPLSATNFAPGVKWVQWNSGSGVVPIPDPTTTLGQPTTGPITVTTQPFININSNLPMSNSNPRNASGNNFTVRWDSYVKIPVDGTYSFSTSSDDGSELYIGLDAPASSPSFGDVRDTVQNNFSQGVTTRDGPVDLQAGYHKIVIFYGQGGGGYSMAAGGPVAGVAAAGTVLANIDPSLFIRLAPTPTFSPAPGPYIGSQLVTISVPTPPAGYSIYYTTDGTTVPTRSSTLYTPGQTLLVTPPETLQAICVAPNFDDSQVAVGAYTQTLSATPVFNPVSGTSFAGSKTITITAANPNTQTFIYYTTDGSIPTPSSFNGVQPNPASVTINANTTINAISISAGYAQSALATASYTRSDVYPLIASCLSSGINTQVNVVFTSKVETTTANTPTNYTITDPNGVVVPVVAAAVETGTVNLPTNPVTTKTGDDQTVRLTTATPLQPGVGYTLTVSNVKDKVTAMAIPATGGPSFPFQYFNGGGVYYNRFDGPAGPDLPPNIDAAPSQPASLDSTANTLTHFPANTPDLPNYPNPSLLPNFEEPQDTNDSSYISVTRGYFIPPSTTFLIFGLSADDAAVLHVYADDNTANPTSYVATQITSANATLPRTYAATAQNAQFQSGVRYYIRTIHQQASSRDNLAVTYTVPPIGIVNGQDPVQGNVGAQIQLTPIIDGLRLIKQPVSRTMVPFQSITLTMDLTGDGPRVYTWMHNGVPIVDQDPQYPEVTGSTTASLVISPYQAQDAGTYTCSVTNPITTTPISSNVIVLKTYDQVNATVTSIVPGFGPSNKTTAITINGNHFVDGMSVQMKSAANVLTSCTSIVAVSAQQITCVTPALPRGTYSVVVTKPGQSSVSPSLNFIYDDIPVANQPAIQNTAEDTPVTFNISGTATSGIQSFQVATPPKKGTVVIGKVVGAPTSATVACTYTPSKDLNNNTAPLGPDTFTFTVSDSLLSSAPVTVTVNISPVNDPPTINPVPPQQVTEDVPVQVNLSGITPGGASDEAKQLLTLSVQSSNPTIFVSPTGINTLTVSSPDASGNAVVSFTPNYSGVVTITVTVSDGQPQNSTTSTAFQVTIIAVNDPPTIANPGPQNGTGDQAGTIQLFGIAPAPPNNPDEAGQQVSLTVSSSDPTFFNTLSVSKPVSGTATISYNPVIARSGTVTLTVVANDGQATNNTTTITFTLTLSKVPHRPVAANDSYSPRVGAPFVQAAPGVLANDTDLDNDPLKAVLVTSTSNGMLTFNSDGSFTYTPNAGFVGTDSFTYQADDGNPPTNLSNVATVTLNVGQNIAPTASGQSFTTLENTPYSGKLVAADLNNDTLTYSVIVPPAKGTLTHGANLPGIDPATGAFTYTPTPNVNGADSFVFKVNDGLADSNPATVSITITPVNQAPVANSQTVYSGEVLSPDTVPPANRVITLVGTDPDGDPLTFGIVRNPAHGTLSGLTQTSPSTATVVYTPFPNYLGNDSFQFLVKDAVRFSNVATVSITVTPPPMFASPPVLSPNPVQLGNPVTGNAAATVANGQATITWTFGDGNTAVGPSVTNLYTQTGVYTVTTTATSPEGVSTSYTQQELVSVGLTGTPPPGTFQPNIFGFLVGGAGITAGDKATLSVNYVKRDKTSFEATVSGIKLPANFAVGEFVNQPSILTIGTGPLAQQFIFTLDSKGKGKATGLPTIQLSQKNGTFSFKVTDRRELTDLIIALGGSNVVPGTRSGQQVLQIPVTVQLGNSFFIAMTFQILYSQNGSTGKGILDTPARHRLR